MGIRYTDQDGGEWGDEFLFVLLLCVGLFLSGVQMHFFFLSFFLIIIVLSRTHRLLIPHTFQQK